MRGNSLKARAIAFAFCIGAVAFILSMLAGVNGTPDAELIVRGVIVAIVCGVMAWASAEQAVASIAEAVDSAIDRVADAAQGDLTSATPTNVGEALPELASSLDGLFRQVRANLDSVHALAMFDPVTSLPNRTHFRRESDRLLRALARDGQAALFFIDLDHFKAVNDSMGHACGDQLLAMVSNRLRAVAASEAGRLRSPVGAPIVGRLAGDEFTILVPGIDGETAASRVARAILAAVGEPFELDGQHLDLGASIGVALRPMHGSTLTMLMRAADSAMYQAKDLGRGKFCIYSDALAGRMADRSRLGSDLRAALDRGEFALAFQPQISLIDGSLVAAEALLRWNHPTDGPRLPESFIASAEDSGVIIELGNWAIDAVAQTLAEWPGSSDMPRLSVNLSPRQLARPDFFSRMRTALHMHDAPVARLEMELSETTAMALKPAVLEELERLRGEGATLAIDDFGTGYSNIARLASLPFDTVKLDRSMIADITTSASARAIAQSVIALVHSIGSRAVAEGVEDAGQLEMLRIMGCDAAQGYIIAEPMSATDYKVWSAVARTASVVLPRAAPMIRA